LNAFSLSGRLSVSERTPASRETRIGAIGKAYNRVVPRVYSIDGIAPIVSELKAATR